MGEVITECREILLGRFPMKMKGTIYRSCVKSAMVYGSKTWCVRESEMGDPEDGKSDSV